MVSVLGLIEGGYNRKMALGIILRPSAPYGANIKATNGYAPVHSDKSVKRWDVVRACINQICH